MAAVSARRMRGPRPVGSKPAARTRSDSCGLPAAGGTDERQHGTRPGRGAVERRRALSLRELELPPVERPREELLELDRRQHLGHDGATALLGGAGRDLLPALLAAALQGRTGGRVRPDADDGMDGRDAELRRLLDDELHAVALQRRQRRARSAAATPARGATSCWTRRKTPWRVTLSSVGLELGAAPVEDVDHGARAEPQDLARVVSGVVRQLEPRAGCGLRHVEAGDAAHVRTRSAAHSPSVRVSTAPKRP